MSVSEWISTQKTFEYNLRWLHLKEKQRPDRSDAASHVGAAVLAQVARSGRSYAALG